MEKEFIREILSKVDHTLLSPCTVWGRNTRAVRRRNKIPYCLRMHSSVICKESGRIS